MPPLIPTETHGLWLSVINAIPDEIANEEKTAIFLVKHLLASPSKEFRERYKLEATEKSVDEVFAKVATLRGCLRQGGLADLDRVHKLILFEFRKGELGKTCFEIPNKAPLRNQG
jgi:ribosome biogenesis GTPase A